MFPAYKESSPAPGTSGNQNWLENKTYDSIPVASSSKPLTQIKSIEDEPTPKRIKELPKKAPVEQPSKYFYEDNKRAKQFLTIFSLPRNVIPKYHKDRKYFRPKSKPFIRYYKQLKKIKKLNRTSEKECDELNSKEENYREQLAKYPHDEEKWLEYYKFKQESYSFSEGNEKQKFELIEKAIHFNAECNELKDIYLDLLPKIHPIDKVVQIIDEMIVKEPRNYVLRNALLICSQTSMVQCSTTEISKLYEKTMKTMYVSNNDVVMLRLFQSVCLFLRQSGLSEQFFAVIQLMLNLNISNSPDLKKMYSSPELQNKFLIEYEELVLQSELPMNELWWRIEKLRSICNFLPVINAHSASPDDIASDPQRFVFNEDVFGFSFPIQNLAYKFDFLMMTLNLLKYPFMNKQSIKHELFNQELYEMECGVAFLSTLLCNQLDQSYKLASSFNLTLFTLVKDLNISPNFLSFNIEHETYLNLIINTIITCSTIFTDKQNVILLTLWLKLERLMIIMDKLNRALEQKETPDDNPQNSKKAIKTRIKKILKQSKHQNDLNIFVEYALIENELGDSAASYKIFEMIISNSLGSLYSGNCDNSTDSQETIEIFKITLNFCELLIKDSQKEKCKQVLRSIIKSSNQECTDDEVINKFSSQIEESSFTDENLYLEDYFISKSNLLQLIKAKIYYILLTKSKKEALMEVEFHIQQNRVVYENGGKTCNSRLFLLEMLWELYVNILQVQASEELENHRHHTKQITEALLEFPANLFILSSVASSASYSWYEIKKILLKNPTVESTFYLIVAAKLRGEEVVDQLESGNHKNIYKQRIFNTLNELIARRSKASKIQKSVLMWRIYLRAAFDYDFEKCKNVLYSSLENAPWCKSTYLDGAIFVPKDMSQLLDLIFEKELRIHTLPEELAILRSDSGKGADKEDL